MTLQDSDTDVDTTEHPHIFTPSRHEDGSPLQIADNESVFIDQYIGPTASSGLQPIGGKSSHSCLRKYFDCSHPGMNSPGTDTFDYLGEPGRVSLSSESSPRGAENESGPLFCMADFSPSKQDLDFLPVPCHEEDFTYLDLDESDP